MKHRSDKLLRQDLLIPCLFDTVADQCINAELQSLAELEELDKTAKGNDKEAILTQRLIHGLRDKYQVKSMNAGDIIQAMIFSLITQHCRQFTIAREVPQRMHKLLRGCINDINSIFLKNAQLKPDKIILIALRIVENLNEQGFEFPPYIQEIFDIFLQIEHLHNIDENVEEWKLLKKSADKQALKYLEPLRKAGYFSMLKI